MEIQKLTPEQQNATIMAFENMPDPLNKRPKGSTPQEIAYFAKLISSQQRIAMIGRQPVTVVNINPFQLMVLGSLFAGLAVEAKKTGEDYSALVLRDVKYEVDQGLDRNHTPVEFWPIQLATEFVTQYAEKGGVFYINGDLETNPELAYTDEFKAKYKAADEQFIAYCRRLKASADGEWNTPNRSGARNIHPPHRKAAEILFERKLITKLPEWMEGDVAAEDVTADCPVCKANTKKGQLICTCSWVLRPYDAYVAGAIDELHTSLERLTRKQVQELGISQFVAETADEKKARVSKGLPKPLSSYEMRLNGKTLDEPASVEPKPADKAKAAVTAAK